MEAVFQIVYGDPAYALVGLFIFTKKETVCDMLSLQFGIAESYTVSPDPSNVNARSEDEVIDEVYLLSEKNGLAKGIAAYKKMMPRLDDARAS